MAVLSAQQRAELFPLASAAADVSTAAASLLWVPGTGRFHRPDCPLVAGKDTSRLFDGDTSDLSACEACEP
jgi:hypothetical protein